MFYFIEKILLSIYLNELGGQFFICIGCTTFESFLEFLVILLVDLATLLRFLVNSTLNASTL